MRVTVNSPKADSRSFAKRCAYPMVLEMPKAGQAHLHYQVDDGPVVATTAPKLSFHGLKPGEHKVVVMLAANDHSALGPQETLNVRVTPSRSK